MPRDSDIPDAFDVYTVVVLRRPADAPQMSDQELDALQARHLAYRAELGRRGLVVANGPFAGQSDPSYRGLSIFACDPADAARLSDGDPSAHGRMALSPSAVELSREAAQVVQGSRLSMPHSDRLTWGSASGLANVQCVLPAASTVSVAMAGSARGR